jgi:hypothetical protein
MGEEAGTASVKACFGRYGRWRWERGEMGEIGLPEGGHHSGARKRIEKLRGRRSTVGGDGQTWEEREEEELKALMWGGEDDLAGYL